MRTSCQVTSRPTLHDCLVFLLVTTFENVINLRIKSGESSGVPTLTWNESGQQSQASVLVTMFTSESYMSTIFHVVRHLRWNYTQWDE